MLRVLALAMRRMLGNCEIRPGGCPKPREPDHFSPQASSWSKVLSCEIKLSGEREWQDLETGGEYGEGVWYSVDNEEWARMGMDVADFPRLSPSHPR